MAVLGYSTGSFADEPTTFTPELQHRHPRNSSTMACHLSLGITNFLSLYVTTTEVPLHIPGYLWDPCP